MKQYIFNVVIFAILFMESFKNVRSTDDNPEVIVPGVGTIRGLRATDGNYSKFLGIPFATVNSSNPFGDSLPQPRFTRVFEAFDDYKPCPQIDGTGTLDCLILNIHVPNSATRDNPLPVMVYIYGGRFNAGNPDDYGLGPKFLVKHDIILVKINYRLGPYGWMCLHTPEVPGNQGLRDQVRGLRWVKEHIAHFGGDPDQITLFGNSAGAMSVDYHVLSEEEILYDKVIIQSGTAFVPAPINGPDHGALFAMSENLGLSTSDYDEALQYLMTFDSGRVIRAYLDSGAYFGPCVETKIQGATRMISNNAVNLSARKAKHLKVMMGSTDDEFLYAFTFGPEAFPGYYNFFGDVLRESFFFEGETLIEAEKIVRNFYMGDENFTEDIRFALSDFYSDIVYIYGTERTLKQYLDSGAEVFYYFFTYVGRRNSLQLPPNYNWRGAYHADELGYLFDFGYVTDEPTPADQLIIDRITKLWTNFAKYGDPTPEPTDLLPVKWSPITRGSPYHYLNITTDINMARKPFHHRMAFWDLFYKTYAQFERARFIFPLRDP